jgi:ubiquinone/menaquinone biosynthesis C-methylase UbiE
MGDWEHIFRKKGFVFKEPREEMNVLIKLLKKEKARKILDLGCGSGRHTVLLAKNGFDVYSTDVSKTGLRMTRKWLNELKLKANVKRASCYRTFPFKDNFFDAVISTQVIHHNYHEKIKFCISEIERVLKPKGILFATVSAIKRRFEANAFKMVAPRTSIPLNGEEKGTVHFIYNKAILKKDFKNFQILNIHKDKSNHYCLIGRLKK